MMDRKVIILILFIFALSIRIISLNINPIKWWDETIYGSLGWNLKSNPFDYSFKYFGDKSYDWPGQSGFRAPLLPYVLSLIYTISENNLFVELFMPFFGAFGVVCLFLLVEKIFNRSIAIWSALFLSVLPLHAYYSGKILTDVFSTTFATITFLFFWLGFHEEKMIFKVLCGIFIALSFLARYTLIWLPVLFLVYLTIKKGSFNYLKGKGFILCALCFIITLLPWLWYSYKTYGTPLGSLLHAQKAVTYWGGLQPWYFYFEHLPRIFSIITIVFVIGFVTMLKEIRNKKYFLFFFWFIFALLFAISMQHKEDRFLLPATPAICTIGAIGVSKIKNKKYQIVLLSATLLLTLLSTSMIFLNESRRTYNQQSFCFLKVVDVLRNVDRNSLIFTDSSPIVYYYTHRETRFIPSDLQCMSNFSDRREVYYLWNKFDRVEKLENTTLNFIRIYSCPEIDPSAIVYKLANS